MSKQEKAGDGIISIDGDLSIGKLIILGLQHAFTMFGATVLVPILTGFNISVALFMAGIGTLLFHLITKGKMPVFLGSSFAFIPAVSLVASNLGLGNEYAQGGIVVAGGIYVLIALLVYLFGYKKVVSFFPPIVTGPIIMVIGLTLAGTAVSSASGNWWLALLSFAVVCAVSVFFKGFIKLLPVIIGLALSYAIAAICGQVDFSPIAEAKWLGLPEFTIAKFDIRAILLIAPFAVATMVEHIGDVIAVGTTVNRDYFSDPGLHRSLLGDGLATAVSAMFGGPANTTYSENTGVLILTGVHKPAVMRVAACFALLMGVVPKLGALISSIPAPIIGGISIVLFGMIASVGIRSLVENQINFQLPRNLLIAAVILVLGIGGAVLNFKIGNIDFSFGGLALAAIIGIILNKVLPEEK